MSVITVSRQMASHGCETAANVARALGFRFIDREIIHRAAEGAGVPKIAGVDPQDLAAGDRLAGRLGLGIDGALGDHPEIGGNAAAAVGFDAPEVVLHQMGGDRVGCRRTHPGGAQDRRAQGFQSRRVDGRNGLPPVLRQSPALVTR